MRTLYYVPMIHADSDQGRLGQKISKVRQERSGELLARSQEEAIQNVWKIIIERARETLPDPKGVIIYQDGLCVELKDKILEALPSRDHFESPNDRLLKELVEKGAILEGTEDIRLVGEFIGIYRQVAEAATISEQSVILRANEERILNLMQKRDEFIAKRINETLPRDGTGILFIGAHHRVIEELERLEKAGQLLDPIRVINL